MTKLFIYGKTANENKERTKVYYNLQTLKVEQTLDGGIRTGNLDIPIEREEFEKVQVYHTYDAEINFTQTKYGIRAELLGLANPKLSFPIELIKTK